MKSKIKDVKGDTLVCEKCGAPGKVRKPDWFGTMKPTIKCDKCYENRP